MKPATAAEAQPSRCAHCLTTDHQPDGCANTGVPMIARACTCHCGRIEKPPAPYWSDQTSATDPEDAGEER